jgi:hypothetical protein
MKLYKISDHDNIFDKVFSSFQSALNYQPIVAIVDASHWVNYKSRILSTCGSRLNHHILLVGFIDSIHTGKSKTHGEKVGEKMDTSEL